jgi:2',3'-cyclic-nucleotide 2'-phosphodiesterase (5'-nucleotidase family)
VIGGAGGGHEQTATKLGGAGLLGARPHDHRCGPGRAGNDHLPAHHDVDEIAPKDRRGGLAELMTLLTQERAAAAHSITTFGGDLISPSVLSGLTRGTVLTRKDILSELPFGNVVVLIELSGADLLAALENGISQLEDAAGRFPQVSGMSYRLDASKPAGRRVVAVEVGGRPLAPGRVYKVATNEYVHGGGDGYAALARGKPIIDPAAGTLIAGAVMDYIARQGAIAPKVEGRIARLN